MKPSDRFDLELDPGKPFDVLGFGLNSVDQFCVVATYPSRDSKSEILRYQKLPGGQTATAVIFLARMGLKTKYVGKVGGDDLGRFSLSRLRSEPIDASSTRIEPEAENQCAVIIVEERSGERTILCRRDPRLNFRQAELDRGEICSGRILHLDGYDGPAAARAAAWCREERIPVSVDLDQVVPSCDEMAADADFVIVSANFPSEFTKAADPVLARERLRERCRGFLAVTLGRQGAVAFLDGRWILFPALEVTAVDTTGAGDIFHAAFLFGVIENWTVAEIMAFANAAAGLACTRLGAWSGIRPLGEILEAARCLQGRML